MIKEDINEIDNVMTKDYIIDVDKSLIENAPKYEQYCANNIKSKRL
jgi:hypothetical protein